MSTTCIPLGERLHSVDVTGCGDPAVLPQMIEALGDCPAHSLFLREEDWDFVKKLLYLHPEQKPDFTYRKLVYVIYMAFSTAQTAEERARAREALSLLAQSIVSMDRYQRSKEVSA